MVELDDDDIGVSGSNKVFKSLEEDEEVRAEDQVSWVKRRRTCQLGYEQREREQLIPAGKNIKDKAATLQISSLPSDVLYCVLDKLLELVDYVRFTAACKQLQTVANDYNLYRQRWLRKPQLLPMLMLPLDDESDNDSSSEPQMKQRLLYSVSERRIYRNINLGLSASYNENLCGYSQGWLASILKSTKELANHRLEVKYEITLRNPFGKASQVIHLPPYIHCFGRCYHHLAEWIPRIILSANPDLHPENYYVLFALYRPMPRLKSKYYSPKLAVIRGQESWITINERLTDNKIDDAIFHRNKICLLIDRKHSLLTLDVGTNNLSQQEIRYLRFEPEPDYSIFCWERYLVESTNGDLLLVSRYYVCKETSFAISKIVFDEENDSSGKTVQLVDVQSIGDDAIFLGQSQSQSVLASSIPGCKPNSIYYATESVGRAEIPIMENGWKSDMGIFNLGDRTRTPLMNSDSIDKWNWNKMNMPFWILPSLNSPLDL